MIRKIRLWMDTRKLEKLIPPPDPIRIIKHLNDVGFSNSQSLAIINAIAEMTKPSKEKR